MLRRLALHVFPLVALGAAAVCLRVEPGSTSADQSERSGYIVASS